MAIDLAETLRSKGLQVTAQRLAVLRAVQTVPHGTADEIADAVRAEIGAISRQAAYDALRALTENELIRRIQPAGSPSLYDPRVGDNHHHVICRTCKKTVDVDCTVGAAPCLTAAETDFQVDEAEVIFWGTCAHCLHQTQAQDAPST